MSSYRVREDEFSANGECLSVEGFAVDLVRGKWRIYEQYHDYSATSGGMERKGKVVRRYDHDAGNREGLPAVFNTKGEAITYAEQWLK